MYHCRREFCVDIKLLCPITLDIFKGFVRYDVAITFLKALDPCFCFPSVNKEAELKCIRILLIVALGAAKNITEVKGREGNVLRSITKEKLAEIDLFFLFLQTIISY